MWGITCREKCNCIADSVLLEGGGTLNDSALRAGIVQKIKVFVAPKIFGGGLATSPVAGEGVALPEEAVFLQLDEIRQIGEDLMLEYGVKKRCLQEL